MFPVPGGISGWSPGNDHVVAFALSVVIQDHRQLLSCDVVLRSELFGGVAAHDALFGSPGNRVMIILAGFHIGEGDFFCFLGFIFHSPKDRDDHAPGGFRAGIPVALAVTVLSEILIAFEEETWMPMLLFVVGPAVALTVL